MLRGKNISFMRGGAPLFSELTFSVKKGEHLAIKGDNGSGKSTFLRVLTGFIPPTEGKLFWEEERITPTNIKLYQQNILYVGHKLSLYTAGSVSDQVKLWSNIYKVSEDRIEKALEIWGMGSCKHKKISHLSQGQQKRLSLTRCSWLMRSLWILDEPEAGLDQGGQECLTESLAYHLSKGGSVIHATHASESKILEIVL
jgi:heme exporter protein A